MRLVSSKQMQAIDAACASEFHMSNTRLMEQAAQAIFLAMNNWLVDEAMISVVCGSGNNGGDGLALARLLYEADYDVRIYMVGDINHLSEATKINYQMARSLGIPFRDVLEGDVIVDALFGTGLNRTISGKYQEVIAAINQLHAKKVSIDIPSGVNADTGAILGCAVAANLTYTLATGKYGLYFSPGRTMCGQLECLDIGIPSDLIMRFSDKIDLIEKQDIHSLLPLRHTQSHKGTYGKVLIIGGAQSMSGAVCLAARSALKSGCGMMCCALVPSIHQIVAISVKETTFQLMNEIEGEMADTPIDFNHYDVILFGCGIGRNERIIPILEKALDSQKPIVIDADGLVAFKPLMDQYANRDNIILTPHLQEFARLSDIELKDIIADQLKSATQFSAKYPDFTLVLKSDTTTISQNNQVFINTYGNSGLAKGGSGDVLSGIITGMYAQNREPLKAAMLGVFLHAYSADNLLKKHSEYGILPSEVGDNVDKVIKELLK